jgi:hypothetical protein
MLSGVTRPKRVVQTFKPPDQWRESPPGLGDFVRGACHLFEWLHPLGIDLRVDVSRTEFAGLIEQDPAVFHHGEAAAIGAAAEYFEPADHRRLRRRIKDFARSDETELFVCTNVGEWDRLALPEATRRFASGFYRFTGPVESLRATALQTPEYEVLSVRCGDDFFNQDEPPPPATRRVVETIIETHILPRAQRPLVVTSDCHALKTDLARRYAMLTLPHRSRHGAYGEALPVAADLCVLRHSRFNYHINVWADWWSGFSHYTSLIFQIPSMNFRLPDFSREEVTASGRLLTARPWWRRWLVR